MALLLSRCGCHCLNANLAEFCRIFALVDVQLMCVPCSSQCRCPKEISFVCVIADLINDALKDILEAIEKGLDLEVSWTPQ
jgi:hypothetical protein